MSHKEFMSMSVRDLKEYLDGLGMNYAGYVILESLVVRESNIINFTSSSNLFHTYLACY